MVACQNALVRFADFDPVGDFEYLGSFVDKESREVMVRKHPVC